mgnify:FL=1
MRVTCALGAVTELKLGSMWEVVEQTASQIEKLYSGEVVELNIFREEQHAKAQQ